jgi:hypothetical protein
MHLIEKQCSRFFGIMPTLLLLAVSAFWSCASAPWESSPTGGSTATPAPASTPAMPVSYDFPDVQIPAELELVAKDSYVFQGTKTKAGLLVFKGRVEARSVLDFFQISMPRENWQFKGGFRYKKSVLVFEKPERICLINVHESLFYTYAEVYVTPMGSQF